MRLFMIDRDYDTTFADAGRRGTWAPCTKDEAFCPECDASLEKRIDPLVIAWERGCDNIADFTFPSIGPEDVIVTRKARDVIESFGHVRFADVVMIDDPAKHDFPAGRKRVRLPYKGPPVYELRVEVFADFDKKATKVNIKNLCDTCGAKEYQFDWKDLVVPVRSTKGAQIFRLRELATNLLVSESVKRAIEEAGLTNITFEPSGRVV